MQGSPAQSLPATHCPALAKGEAGTDTARHTSLLQRYYINIYQKAQKPFKKQEFPFTQRRGRNEERECQESARAQATAQEKEERRHERIRNRARPYGRTLWGTPAKPAPNALRACCAAARSRLCSRRLQGGKARHRRIRIRTRPGPAMHVVHTYYYNRQAERTAARRWRVRAG